MTFRDVINHLLQSLEVGQVNEKDEVVPYQYHGSANETSLQVRLVFRTVERGVRYLKKHEHFSFDQTLTDMEIRVVYDAFIAQVAKATLPEQLGKEYMAEIRQEARDLIEEVIDQHRHLRARLNKRVSA